MPSESYALEPPPLTPVDQFFVENNNGVPDIPGDWRLTVDGAVAAPLSLDMEDLMNSPAATVMATLVCLGDPFDPDFLTGNANWTGVPLRDILEAAGPLSGAQSVIFHCIDGYRVRFSLAEMLQREDDLLAYGMNGVTLPLLQGYPLRLVLPGDIGPSWAQWLERIEVSTAPPANSFSPIPLHAQIVSPQNGSTLEAGTHRISGMAVVGDGREITGVDISTDGGATWEPARLLSSFVPNAWKWWEFTWEASAGDYEISARAHDNEGNQQGSDGFFTIAALSISVTVDDDSDEDGLPDDVDNCPYDYNPDQEDSDNDGTGDVCESETTTTTTTTAPHSPCMIERLYGEDSEDTGLCRYFRDSVLSRTPEGRAIIRLYYAGSPFIVRAMEENQAYAAKVKEIIDSILPLIGKV